MTKTIENPVTRYNTYDREEIGTVVRLFSKRKLVGEIELEDIVGDKLEMVEQFLLAKPRDYAEVEDYLTTEGDLEDEEFEAGGSIVPNKYRERYGVTQRCGDTIAETLSTYVTLPRAGKKDIDGGLDRDRLREVANANGLGAKLDDYEARNFNGGLLRMNISNILRGMERRGEKVVIGGTLFPAREVEKKARKRTKKAK
jgi:hypothetical protein